MVYVGSITNKVDSLRLGDAYLRHHPGPSLVQLMACRLFGAKPLSETMLYCCQWNPYEQTSVKLFSKFKHFHWRKRIWKCRLKNVGHFVLAAICYVIKEYQYNMHMAGLCFLVVISPFVWWIQVNEPPIFIRVASLALEQLHYFSSCSKSTLKYHGWTLHNYIKIQQTVTPSPNSWGALHAK